MKKTILKSDIEKLQELKVFLRPQFRYGDTIGTTIIIQNKVLMEQYSMLSERSLTWNKDVRIGSFSYVVNGSKLEGCHIGRYCSI